MKLLQFRKDNFLSRRDRHKNFRSAMNSRKEKKKALILKYKFGCKLCRKLQQPPASPIMFYTVILNFDTARPGVEICRREATKIGCSAEKDCCWICEKSGASRCLCSRKHILGRMFIKTVTTWFKCDKLCHEDVIYTCAVIQVNVASSMTAMVKAAVRIVLLID